MNTCICALMYEAHIWAHIYDCAYMRTHICVYTHASRACVICRFRKGWSSLRKGTRHGQQHIQRLWRLAIDQPQTRAYSTVLGRTQKRARDQLQRHGFDNKRRCTLLDHAKLILVRDPRVVRQPLFHHVIYNDLLHWEKNCCDYVFDALLGVMTKAMTIECDSNASQLPMFRNPDGSGIRRFDQVCKNTYLTTARRVTLIFAWVHALGTKALFLPPACRVPALTMLANMQIMILASQGKRAYTLRELQRLYVDRACELFSAMEFLLQYQEAHDTSANATTFTPLARYVYHYMGTCMHTHRFTII